jgi:O-acetyl-ADP-ribose deacetylase (regulator of RNase III)
MIHYVEGDILKTKAQALAHGIAPMDPMTKGLARALHEAWPAMHKDFHHYCHQQHPKPGDAWAWGTHGARIVNLITQEGGYGHGQKPGRATLPNVNHTLRALKKLIQSEDYQSVALPRLATGVGGLDWADVKPLIERHLGELSIPVYVYETYHPGVEANEP